MIPRSRRPIAHPTDPGVFLVPLTRGLHATIDAADAVAVGEHLWRAQTGWNSSYAGRGNPMEMLHRFIGDRMGLAPGLLDHRNLNGLDCRRCNLRSATKQQNGQNRGKFSSNTSGIKGVVLHRQTGKWQAQITAAGKYKYLGLFDTKELAEESVVSARVQLHGAFARSN